METSNNFPAQTAVNCPDIGKILSTYFESISLNRAKLSRQIKMSGSSVFRFLDRDTMQIKTLWSICTALNHNFIAELGEKLPVKYVTTSEKELQAQVETLQKELDRINIELSVYKNIMVK